ncbi:3-hydroxy-3-methylglutaryl CoA reductase 2 [Tanacetum coccineum]
MHNDVSPDIGIQQMAPIHVVSQQENPSDCNMSMNTFSRQFLDITGASNGSIGPESDAICAFTRKKSLQDENQPKVSVADARIANVHNQFRASLQKDETVCCSLKGELKVGTVGGRTQVTSQLACLNLLGIEGAHIELPGSNAQLLANVVIS